MYGGSAFSIGMTFKATALAEGSGFEAKPLNPAGGSVTSCVRVLRLPTLQLDRWQLDAEGGALIDP